MHIKAEYCSGLRASLLSLIGNYYHYRQAIAYSRIAARHRVRDVRVFGSVLRATRRFHGAADMPSSG